LALLLIERVTLKHVTLAVDKTYYVSIRSDYSNPGTQAKPWGSIKFGTEQLLPGDTFLLQDSTNSEQIALSILDTEEDPLTIRARNMDQVMIHTQGYDYGLHIFGSNYVPMQGFVRLLTQTQAITTSIFMRKPLLATLALRLDCHYPAQPLICGHSNFG
jgi:hypothetical protein